MLLVCPNRSQPLSLDHINSHTSSNGQIAKIFTVNSAPQITPWVFRIRRHGRLVYRFGRSGMGNNAFTAQPVISSDSRASRRLTASARESRLRSKGFSMTIDILSKVGHGCGGDNRECSTE